MSLADDASPSEHAPGGVHPTAHSLLEDWRRAVSHWNERGDAGPLDRWLTRELDPDGVPRSLPVTDWLPAFREMEGSTVPLDGIEGLDARIEGWFRVLLRYSRTNGSSAFGPTVVEKSDRRLFRAWSERLSDPGFQTVVDWWFPPSPSERHAPPPLPADSRPDRPFAILRANWAKDGDFLAVDHREAGTDTRVELFGRGRPWLGPDWSSPGVESPGSTALPSLWVSHSTADIAEWSYPVGRARVTRSAVLMRGRRLALLSEQWDGPGDPGSWRVDLSEGVEATPNDGTRVLNLTAPRSRVTPRAIPIGLPRSTDLPTAGSFGREGHGLVLRNEPSLKRSWRPLLLSWEPQRDRRPVHWRPLTVTEDRKVCGPETAVAVRVTWGRDETLVIYRSLAPAAVRAFLGHQTQRTVRFLVALFSVEGDVEPLLVVHE